MRKAVLAAALAVPLTGLLAAPPPRAAPPTAVAAGAITPLFTPVAGAIRTQGFGCTSFDMEPPEPACPGGHFHAGVDLGARGGSPVLAAAGGLVQVIDSRTGYGLHVVIDHGRGVTTLYGHLSAVAVATGELVARGSQIGSVGSTGNSTGPHLHFEVRSGGRPVDPEQYLPAAQQRGGSP